MKEFILGLVSIVVALVILAAGGEIVTRLLYMMPEKVDPHRVVGVITLDPDLGWVSTADYSFDGELVDASGASYAANIRTDHAGYRMFGNPQVEGRKKVLFLGDSFTQAMHVSNDKTYYGILGKDLDLEVFAFGVEGYGTLQEYMLLDKIIDDVKPDAVVLQFCPNDFINNHYELELAARHNNNGLRRPYFAANEIDYRTPSRFAGLREFAANYSNFLYLILKKIDILNATTAVSADEESSETRIEKEGMAYPEFQESVAVTEELLKKIRQRVPASTPVYLFSTHHVTPYLEQSKRIAQESGIIFIDGASQAITAAEQKGVTTRAADNAHWNNAGHQIAAEVLERYFSETGNFASARPAAAR